MGLVPYFLLQAWQHLDHHRHHLLNHRATTSLPPSILQLTGSRVGPDALPSLTPKSTGACPTSSISRVHRLFHWKDRSQLQHGFGLRNSDDARETGIIVYS